MPETNGHKGTTAGNGGTGGNGDGSGAPGESKLAAVLAEAKAVQARAVEELKETVKAPHKTDVWKSILRVKHDESPRSRALGILSNVFLHLHPAKINRDAVSYDYTWGMGGMTFYIYITLVFTGTLLMFYYHPSKVIAFRDILYLESDVPFGKLLRNMHRWGAHLMVIMVELHMFRVFLTGSYKTVSYTHLRAHETRHDLVCRLLLEKK